MNSFLNVLVDIASTPAILVGLIAVLGLCLQKKPAGDVVRGGIKTFIGFLVVTAGANVVVGSLTPFGEMFQEAFHMTGVIPNNEAIVAIALTEFGTYTALIMLISMVFNTLIARFTRFKYIYLTGHAILYMSCMTAAILSVTNMPGWLLVLLGGLIVGLADTIMPAIAQPFTKKVIGNDTVALGHTGDLGYALAGWVGEAFKKDKKSTEDIKFPQGLSFLRDSTVAITLTMGVVYIIVALCCGPAYIQDKLSDGTNYIVYAVQQAGTFAAGVFVILAGVRLILAEIIPAFKGISEKLVPGAVPALDCPIVFPYAPNAVLIGFLSSFVGGLVSMVIMVFTGTIVVIPGVVPHFFCGATAGVYGNATGGVKGCVFGSFIHGILISFMPLLLMPVLGNLGFAGSTFSDTDYGAVGIVIGGLVNMGGTMAVVIGVIAILAIIFLLSYMKGKRKSQSPEA